MPVGTYAGSRACDSPSRWLEDVVGLIPVVSTPRSATHACLLGRSGDASGRPPERPARIDLGSSQATDAGQTLPTPILLAKTCGSLGAQ